MKSKRLEITISQCLECTYCNIDSEYCELENKSINDIYNIPDFCPLEDE